jgi:dipeptidase D
MHREDQILNAGNRKDNLWRSERTVTKKMKPDRQSVVLAARVMVIFAEIIKFRHSSGAEDELREYVIDFIQKLKNPAIQIVHYKSDVTAPGDRVIVVRKAAQNGGKSDVKMVLQAHLDMVCNPSDMTFPLTTYTEMIDNTTWLKGRSHDGRPSTLGADDGIGVATALAILEDTVLPVGQLECLFTVQEEVDMGGAEQFNPGYLEGRLYLNLDSEDADIITYGSAGGLKSILRRQPDYVPFSGKDTVMVKLQIFGLCGGHSGVNIDEGRANAIQLLARVLFALSGEGSFAPEERFDFRIDTFTTANKATNVIPMDAAATVAISRKDQDRFQAAFARLCTIIKNEYLTTDPNLSYGSEVIARPEYQTVLSFRETVTLLGLLVTIPHGVLRLEPETGNVAVRPVVQTSSNLALVNRENNYFQVTCSHRSSSASQLDWVAVIHRALASAYGFDIGNTAPYPAWTPNAASPLLKIAREVYSAYYGNDSHGVPLWQATVIHAGLECGWIVAKYREDVHSMDCIAIGPTVKDMHTPDERLNLDSVADFCDCLIAIITKLST